MPFVKQFSRPEDCIFGSELHGKSSARPRFAENETIIKLVGTAACCIEKEVYCSKDAIIKKLQSFNFNPHCENGDYISGSELKIKNGKISDKNRDSNKRNQHRENHANIETRNNCEYCACFVESTSYLNQKISFEHRIKVENIIKIIR